jgi:hypothetical protein
MPRGMKRIFKIIIEQFIGLLTWLSDLKYPENQLCEVAISHMYPWEESHF